MVQNMFFFSSLLISNKKREQTLSWYIICYLMYFLYNVVSLKTQNLLQKFHKKQKNTSLKKNLHAIRIVSMCNKSVKESPSQLTSTWKGHTSPQFYLKWAMNQNILVWKFINSILKVTKITHNCHLKTSNSTGYKKNEKLIPS